MPPLLETHLKVMVRRWTSCTSWCSWMGCQRPLAMTAIRPPAAPPTSSPSAGLLEASFAGMCAAVSHHVSPHL